MDLRRRTLWAAAIATALSFGLAAGSPANAAVPTTSSTTVADSGATVTTYSFRESLVGSEVFAYCDLATQTFIVTSGYMLVRATYVENAGAQQVISATYTYVGVKLLDPETGKRYVLAAHASSFFKNVFPVDEDGNRIYIFQAHEVWPELGSGVVFTTQTTIRLVLTPGGEAVVDVDRFEFSAPGC